MVARAAGGPGAADNAVSGRLGSQVVEPVETTAADVSRPHPRPRPGPEPAGTDGATGTGARRRIRSAGRTGDSSAGRGNGVIGVPGIVLMIAGAIMLLVSFTSANWYRGSQGADAVDGIGFSDLHHNLDAFDAPAASRAYFGWVAWLLLILLILVGLMANLPSRRADGLRMTGFVLGLVGAAFTYYALSRYVQALTDRGASQGRALDHAQSGIWLALIGYVLAGIGAAIGPLRRPSRKAQE